MWAIFACGAPRARRCALLYEVLLFSGVCSLQADTDRCCRDSYVRCLMQSVHHVRRFCRRLKKLASSSKTLEKQHCARTSSSEGTSSSERLQYPHKQNPSGWLITATLLLHGKPRRNDVRGILLVVQNHGVRPSGASLVAALQPSNDSLRPSVTVRAAPV